MAGLAVRLLGSFEVTLDRAPIQAFESVKVKALLAYLAAEADRPANRAFLAEMLWPERPAGAARANLRHALGMLRAALGESGASAAADPASALLVATHETLGLNEALAPWVDTRAFSRLLARSNGPAPPLPESLERAVALYRGPFLDDITLEDSNLFQEWALVRRERFEYEALHALRRLAESWACRGDLEKALAFAWRQVALAPWNEAAHRQVMRWLALGEGRASALAHFETCRQLLARELGVEPGAKTQDLYERIRDERLVAPAPAGPAQEQELSRPGSDEQA